MIHTVTASAPTFRSVDLEAGFNVVLADRTKEATRKDSRNGLGKSTLIEIIHFCLGANATKGKGLRRPALAGWEFHLGFDAGGQTIIASRATDDPGTIYVDAETEAWPVAVRTKNGRKAIAVKEWNKLLGQLVFGLRVEADSIHSPSFRSLISYFIRRKSEAFTNPFVHHRQQGEGDKQVHNTFLLGLSWEHAREYHLLKEKEKGLKALKQAAKLGLVAGQHGTLGELEARRVQLAERLASDKAQLAAFKIHEQYGEIESEANALTAAIHEHSNANLLDRRRLELYQRSIREEEPPEQPLIDRVYEAAGVALPAHTLRRIEDVKKFHATIVENRAAFLAEEIGRLETIISGREAEIEKLDAKRAKHLAILRSHGALGEFTGLQNRLTDSERALNAVIDSITNLKSCQEGLSELKIEKEQLNQRARRDYDEREAIRTEAIALFNHYSERLYEAPGRLLIDITDTGYKFDIEIERGDSTGFGNMKIFCYDLMLATLWSKRQPSPGFLIHDSNLFDGVDERQRARALELAAEESANHGFQYLCLLNSDMVPTGELADAEMVERAARLRLTDAEESGGLLGLRIG